MSNEKEQNKIRSAFSSYWRKKLKKKRVLDMEHLKQENINLIIEDSINQELMKATQKYIVLRIKQLEKDVL